MGNTRLSDAVDHDVFEVPSDDKLQQGRVITGMDMDAMKGDDHAREKMTMKDGDSGMPDMAGEEIGEGGHGGGEGLEIIRTAGAKVDKTVNIGMNDWKYDTDQVMVKKGEIVKLVVTNNGNTPHEFMLMSMPGMKAVNYRLQRADWNLLEHEALFEVPVMMPGDNIQAVFEIEDSGMWMFMCMFPYHMQMGMMGMMMTPDRMGMMGSM